MGWFGSTLLTKLHLLSILTFAIVLTLTQATDLKSFIKIDGFGVFPVEPDDVSMVFYANASHTGQTGDENVLARLKMTQCCLHLSDGSSDCESMKLVSEMVHVLHPNHSDLLQMYFMNLNLLDRNGSCEVHLLTKPQGVKSGWTKGEEFTIPFNTLLPEPRLWQALWMSIGGRISGVRVDDSDNDNPHMAHEDCQVRYGGSRSIKGENISCEKTPPCEGSNRLSPVTGHCGPPPTLKQIEDSFSPEMLEHSPRPPNKTRTKSAPTYIIKTTPIAARFHVRSHSRPGLICEHGDLISKNGSGNCSCHPGWSTSQSYEEWVEEGGTSTTAVYKMCDKATFDRGSMGKLLIIGLVVFIVLLLCGILASACTKKKDRRHKHIKKDDKNYEELSNGGGYIRELESNNEDDDDADQVITEVANRREASYTLGRRDNISQALPPAPAVESRQDLDQVPRGTFSQRDYGRQEALSRKSSRSSKGQIGNHSNEKVGQLAFSTSSEFFLAPSSGGFSVGSSIARRTPSTDELLDLSQNEKWTAHVPLNPLPSYTSSLEEVVTDPNNNNNCGSSLSSSAESMTKQKKLEWVDYTKSASEERLSTKSWRFSGGKLLPVVEDENEEEDFANNNNAERASKVQSLPEMQFRSTPNPPEKLVEESVKAMKPEEFESRQLCYSILKSLSNPRLAPPPSSTRREGMSVRSSQSIWSNVASENAEEPEPEVASKASSYSELRATTIYDLGSDLDSDSALNEIIRTGAPRLSVAETFAQNQKLLLEADQTPSDVYQESSGPSKVSSSEFWNDGQSSRSHVPTHTNPDSWIGNRLDRKPSTEVESAYRVKSSLEQSLKASRSRSAANFF